MNRASIMHQSLLVLSAKIALLILVGFPTPGLAWGKMGHVVICEIAYREVQPQTRDTIDALLKANDKYASFSQACQYADRNPRKFPTAHYVNYPRDLKVVTEDTCPPGVRTCVLSAIRADSARLANPSVSKAERGEAMILLGHWIGDVHQPLHVSFKDDRGGNRIKKRGTCRARNLHAVWDTCVVERRVMISKREAQEYGWDKLTRAHRAADRLRAQITDKQRLHWSADPVSRWAAESFDVARLPIVQYCTMQDEKCLYESGNPTLDNDEEPRTVRMSDRYLDRIAGLVEGRLKRAAVRLAARLNQALN